MNPFLTCSSLPHPLHRNAIRSPHRQSHRRWIWAIYAALKPSFTERPAQRQRCAPEPVAVLRPQSLAWDRHREIEGKFCKVVGGVISPVLANLFLHYAFDMWMRRVFPAIPFERYADDVICHCRTREEA